ncbi:MAG: nucleotide exchange factor GrpE [Rikenellaceae bacterium]|nr:nucleotide exchange factor GrpE [Rikenellaceae bacterium]
MADQTDAEPVDEAAEALAKAEAEAAEWRDKYLRLQAEFDNYRKRTLKEKMSLVESGGENVIKALLPVVDDVDRALAAMEKSDDVEALRGGVRLISQKFNEVMRQQGVSEIEAVGKEFDVDVHEAVARFPIDGKNSGEIIDVVQKGYKLGDKVIRYAKVVVAE